MIVARGFAAVAALAANCWCSQARWAGEDSAVFDPDSIAHITRVSPQVG
jgi:hypothetical protein